MQGKSFPLPGGLGDGVPQKFVLRKFCRDIEYTGEVRGHQFPFQQLGVVTFLDFLAPDFVFPVKRAVLFEEGVVFFFDVVAVGQVGVAAQFAFQAFFGEPKPQLKGVRRGVGELVVDVVVKDRGPAAERQNTAFVGEGVEGVVPALGDGQGAVQDHPVDEVGDLADTPADARAGLAERKLHARQKTAPGRGRADPATEGKHLARPDDQPVERPHGNAQVDDLVALQVHVAFAELFQQHGLVLDDPEGEEVVALFAGVATAVQVPGEPAAQTPEPDGQEVERGVAAAQRRGHEASEESSGVEPDADGKRKFTEGLLGGVGSSRAGPRLNPARACGRGSETWILYPK